MILIDDKKLNLEDKSAAKSAVLKDLQNLWLELEKMFDLSNGGNLILKWNKNLLDNSVEILDDGGRVVGTRKIRPASISVPCSVNFYDKDNALSQVIYYEKQRMTQDGRIHYEPNAIEMNDDEIIFTKKDKEKILFLLTFSSEIQPPFIIESVNLASERTNLIVLDNAKLDSERMLDEEKKQAEIYLKVKGLEKKELVAFAQANSIIVNERNDTSIIKSDIIRKIKQSEKLYIALCRWVKEGMVNMTSESMMMLEINKAINENRLSCDVTTKEGMATWFYILPNGGLGDNIVTFNGTKDVMQLMEYFKHHAEDYNKFLKR